jgi:uncharacterized protein (TIRG00374 family)
MQESNDKDRPQGDARAQASPAAHASRRGSGRVRPTSSRKRSAIADEGEDQGGQAKKGMLFLAAVILVYILYLVLSGQMSDFVSALSQVDRGWLIAACVCFCFYFFFGVGAYVVAVWLDPDSPVGIRDLMSVEASGIFFGNLTPLMMGSVPAQVYRLTRAGLDVGEATATQLTRFIMFQVGEVLFSALMLAARFGFFLETYGDIVFLNLAIFFLHLLQLVGLFVVCLCPGLVMRVGNAAIKWVSKRGWFKKADYSKWYNVVNNEVAEFSDAFRRAAKHLPSMALTCVVTLCQLSCLYMIPWFVLHAFGYDADFLSCLAAASMVQLIATAVPLPGGTGGTEGGFALFFGPLFGASTTAGFLVWRVITFFAPTLVAAALLSLRSTHTDSIYQRWNTFRHGSRRRVVMTDVHRASHAAVRATRGAGAAVGRAGREVGGAVREAEGQARRGARDPRRGTHGSSDGRGRQD